MLRDCSLILVAVLVGPLACAARPKPAPAAPEPEEPVSWSVVMKSHRDLTPALAHGAGKAGCTLKVQRELAFNAVCPGGVYVYAYMSQRRLVRGCGEGITRATCTETWGKILGAVDVVEDDEAAPAGSGSAAPEASGSKL